MPDKLRWGILGAGRIATELADGINDSATGELLAIGSRTQTKADEFGETYDVPRRYGSYEALLADPEVQAVYIATPHPMHAEWALKGAEAGKHLLVEKPIGINQYEAMAMIDMARIHDVFLMEAFMYRCHPQMARLVELIQDGQIGEVQFIQAAFSYRSGSGPESRCFAQELGGGGILDVGCYPVSASRLIAGAAHGKPFENPTEVRGCAHLGETGVDEWATASLKFPGGILAQVSTGVGLNLQEVNTVHVFGTEGRILVPDPWIPSRFNRDPVKMILKRHDQEEPREIAVEAPLDLYTYEANMVARHLEERQAPAMSWDDTLGNMQVLDQWRNQVGLVYEMEEPKNLTHTVSRRPLRVSEGHRMAYGTLPGLQKPVSRLIMGCASSNTMPDTAILLDEYFEHGGNAFDVSHGYGAPNGAPERCLGQWVGNRGVRDQVVIIEKGGNPPHVTPSGVDYELRDGLERLQMDCVDLFVIHRDNEQVPIGEWVDLLNEHLNAGHMTAFGLSNFSIPRLEAFRKYAEEKGLASFSAVSNHLGLAEVQDSIWPSCHLVFSSDQASREWFTNTQTPLLPWSSQCRGFFTERASRQDHSDLEMVRCWYSPTNFRRKDRAEELAAKKGVEPINIALAWVLHQPFPVFPLIGPRRIWEVRSSLKALGIELSPDEVKWLNLEE